MMCQRTNPSFQLQMTRNVSFYEKYTSFIDIFHNHHTHIIKHSYNLQNSNLFISVVFSICHVNSFRAGTVCRRQNPTSTDVRLWRLKTVPELKELKYL